MKQPTAEELRQTADAMDAFYQGNPIEILSELGSWIDWCSDNGPNWRFNDFRAKREPKTRPWSKPEDVPGPICWVRTHDNLEALVIAISDISMTMHAASLQHVQWEDTRRLSLLSYSTDRKTWKPCTVEE